MKSKVKERDLIILIFVSALALLPRLTLLFASNFGIESDEAIVGLMAKHILEGKSWPIFYYGQDYMGSFEAFVMALFFRFFGVSNTILKVTPLVFSILQVITVYYLAKRLAGRNAAIFSSLLTALAPSALILWSSKARGGFIEMVFLGNLALLIACDVIRPIDKRKKTSKDLNFNVFLLGIVLGFSWWVNNQTIFYIVSIAICVFYAFIRDLGILKSIKPSIIGAISFILGGIPFWYANFFLEPRFSTFKTLLLNDSTPSKGFLAHFKGFLSEAFPIITGARRFWSTEDIFHNSSLFAFLLFTFILLAYLLILFRHYINMFEKRRELMLILVFFTVMPLIFSASKFGWLSLAPRYLIPMYSVLYVIVGVVCARFYESKIFILKAFAYIVLLSVLSLNLLNNYLNGIALAGEPFVYKGERVSKSHQELYAFLKDNNYNHIFTNYWIGYRVAFETGESVTFSRSSGPRVMRIPEYENQHLELEELVFVFVPVEAREFERTLAALGFRFRSTKLDSYIVIDLLQAPSLGEELKIDTLELSSSHNQDTLANMFDDKLGTRWGSAHPMSSEMFVDIIFNQKRLVSAVQIDQGLFTHDAAKELSLIAQGDNGNCLLFDSTYSRISDELHSGSLSSLMRRLEIYFRPLEIDGIRVEQHGEHPVFDWSIAEFDIY